MAQDPWVCFLCQDNSEQMSGTFVRPRADHETRRKCLFNSSRNDVPSPILNPDGTKRRIRVLSLFDGIATGKSAVSHFIIKIIKTRLISGLLALEQLGLEVESYFASEIDPDALKVTKMNYPLEVIHLGDVRSIDEEKLRELSPIDLLVGGSPCNDLSIANPHRKGLDGKTLEFFIEKKKNFHLIVVEMMD